MPNGANPKGILENQLKVFEKETGLKTNVVVLDWGEAWNRIHNALEKGEGPDVLQLGTTWVPYYIGKGWLANLDTHMDSFNPNRFVRTNWNTTHIDHQDTSVQGNETKNIYSIPWFVDLRVLLANQKVLDHLNIQESDLESYDKFIEVLGKIKNLNLKTESGQSIYPYSFPGKSDWNIPHNFAPWIWSENGDFIVKTASGWTSHLMTENTIRGIRKYIRFVLDGYIDKETLKQNTANVQQRFNNGELAFVVGTSEVIMQTRIDLSEGGLKASPIGKDGIRTFPIPKGSGGSISFMGGSNLCIPAAKVKTPNAFKLLGFLVQPEQLAAYSEKIGFMPPDKEELKKWQLDSIYSPLVKATKTGRAYPSIPEWGDIESMLVSMFSDIWTLLESEGYYSDEELYTVIAKWNQLINAKLGSQIVSKTDFSEFQSWISVDDSIQVAENIVVRESKSWLDWLMLVLAALALILLVLIFRNVFKEQRR
jgi:multiple sugar transport system substrate-binding protein